MEQIDYDEKIAAIESRIGNLSGQLALARQKYIEATAERLKWFYVNEARETAKNQTSVTTKLGKDGLAQMKAAVADLEAHADQVAAQELDQRELWPDYLGSRDWMTRHNTGEISPDHGIDTAVKRAASRLGGVLTKYGYALDRVHSERRSSYYDNMNQWSWFDHARDPSLQAPSTFPASKEMDETMSECRKLAGQLGVARKELSDTKTAKAQAEAADLWDRA